MNYSNYLEFTNQTLKKMDLLKLKKVGLDRTLESFYLVGPYPPLLQMDKVEKENQSILNNIDCIDNALIDLYVHFPYCRVAGKRECSFCHFYKENYCEIQEEMVVDGWIKEISIYKEKIENISINTLYFGGGSVSLIKPKNLKRFVNFLFNELKIKYTTEVKFEIHADAAKTPEHINEILDIIDIFENLKLVIDIQSLNSKTLNYVSWGRVNVEDYFDTLNLVIERGFNSICTGLILGLPYETEESFLDGVIRLAAIPEIEMLNIFPLMFKECNHVINFLNNTQQLMFDVETRDLISVATRKLLKTYGFKESPIYFYNRGDSEPVHQLNKFKGQNMLLAIGPSAFGYIPNVNGKDINYYNVPSINKYLEKLDNNELPIWCQSELEGDRIEVRSLLLAGINMLKPFSTKNIVGKIKEDIDKCLELYREEGLIYKDRFDMWNLTEKGTLRAEEMSYFIASLDIGEDLYNSLSHEQKSSLHFFPNRKKIEIDLWRNRLNI